MKKQLGFYTVDSNKGMVEQVNLGYLSGIIGTVAGLIGAIIGTYFEMRRAKQGKDYKYLTFWPSENNRWYGREWALFILFWVGVLSWIGLIWVLASAHAFHTPINWTITYPLLMGTFFGLFFGLWLLMHSTLIKANRLIESVKEQNASTTTPEIVIVEEMGKETAKQKVLKYMREHTKSNVIELHKNIRCDIGLLVEIIDELRREGKIGED